MITKNITYNDLNDVERTETFYFDLSKPEIVRMQASEKGGYDAQLRSIASAGNPATIMNFFEDFIRRAYGEKSEDGRRFIKSEELSNAFMQTPAYEVLFDELTTDADKAAEFVNSVLRAKVNK